MSHFIPAGSKGEPGPPGERGSGGEPGSHGRDGKCFFSFLFHFASSSWIVKAKSNGTLDITMTRRVLVASRRIYTKHIKFGVTTTGIISISQPIY